MVLIYKIKKIKISIAKYIFECYNVGEILNSNGKGTKRSYIVTSKVDILKGSIVKNIIMFTLPIMLQSILQTLYNIADLYIVGEFAPTQEAGKTALAAVGATSSIFNVMTALFMGIAVGVDVVTSYNYGREHYDKVKKAIDTAIVSALFLGVICTGIGLLVARPVLVLMDTPAESGVLDQAVLYLSVLMAGVPFSLMFNFCSAIFRTAGKTNKPFIYLAISGALNVLLNLLFVAVFGWGVFGVALATVISQAVSCVLLFITLLRNKGLFTFSFKNIEFSWKIFGRIVAIGIPAGLQSSAFSLSNAFLQTGINYLKDDAIAAGTAVNTFEGLMWVTLCSFNNTTTTFISQNYGAGDMKRAKKSAIYGLLMTAVLGVILGLSMYFAGDFLMNLFKGVRGNEVALNFARDRYYVTFPIYFLAGIMSVMPGVIRGFGSSLPPSIISLVGACGSRIIWVFTVFEMVKDQPHAMSYLFLIHPITWVLTNIALFINLIIVYRKAKRRINLWTTK